MDYVLVCLIGIVGGGFVVFFALHSSKKIVDENRKELDSQKTKLREVFDSLKVKQVSLDEASRRLTTARSVFDKLPVSYKELQDENTTLKRDLRNLYINIRKCDLDVEQQGTERKELSQRVESVGSHYLNPAYSPETFG